MVTVSTSRRELSENVSLLASTFNKEHTHYPERGGRGCCRYPALCATACCTHRYAAADPDVWYFKLYSLRRPRAYKNEKIAPGVCDILRRARDLDHDMALATMTYLED